MTALPVLVLGLAWALPLLLRSATAAFFAALALAVSMEGVLNNVVLTEGGYEGTNLLSRSINQFYPLHQHFFTAGQEEIPLIDLAFWALLLAALFLRPRRRGLHWALAAAAALAPFLWSRSEAISARLGASLSPYMARLSSSETEAGVAQVKFHVPLRMTKAAQVDGRLRARPGITSPGLVNFSMVNIPALVIPNSGIYRLTFPGLRVEPPNGQVSGHLIISSRYTVQVVSPWNSRSSYSLIGGAVDDDDSITFGVHEPGIYYIYTDYSGHGELALDGISGVFLPVRVEPQLIGIHRVAYEARGRPLQAAVVFSDVAPGLYRIRFDLEGSTFARFFERRPAPIRTAVYSALPDSGDRFADTASLWFGIEPRGWSTANKPRLPPSPAGRHPPALVAVHPRRRRPGQPVALRLEPAPGRWRPVALRRPRRPGTEGGRPLPRNLRPPRQSPALTRS